MISATAKVFKSGAFQAIRLPKEMRLKARTVKLVQSGETILVINEAAERRRKAALAKLFGSCPDFPESCPLPLPKPPAA